MRVCVCAHEGGGEEEGGIPAVTHHLALRPPRPMDLMDAAPPTHPPLLDCHAAAAADHGSWFGGTAAVSIRLPLPPPLPQPSAPLPVPFPPSSTCTYPDLAFVPSRSCDFFYFAFLRWDRVSTVPHPPPHLPPRSVTQQRFCEPAASSRGRWRLGQVWGGGAPAGPGLRVEDGTMTTWLLLLLMEAEEQMWAPVLPHP